MRFLLFICLLLLVSNHSSLAQETDRTTGLIIAEGWQAVAGNCLECHSAQMITQNAGNKAIWRSRIRWMQSTQGLGILAPELEADILDYLSRNYGERAPTRRAAIPRALMPANPYPTTESDD